MIARYRREIAAARQRVLASRSRLAETDAGKIEYLDSGDGAAVLVIHGVVGGCDHGPGMASSFLREGFRSICVSRFGYVRSALAKDSSASAQADLYAALLDELGIRRAAVLATSAGTSSSLRFAAKYPQRCSALALFSMAVPPYVVPAKPVLLAQRAFFSSDFLFWAAMRYTPAIRRLMGIPRALEGRLTPSDESFVSELMGMFLPISSRAAGVINDVVVSNPDLNDTSYVSQIEVPVLAFHAKDDPWGSFAGAREIIGCIPGARFKAIEQGGHLLLGHRAEVREEISDFMSEFSRDASRPLELSRR
jgi:pimeloyl-ACP methyl ester carboxylesterase